MPVITLGLVLRLFTTVHHPSITAHHRFTMAQRQSIMVRRLFIIVQRPLTIVHLSHCPAEVVSHIIERLVGIGRLE
jgi:hypothetical protein